MVKSVFDLDMTPGRMLPLIINVSQYDDIGRTIVFNLYSSVGAWTAPTSAAVTFEGGKPDGKFFAYNCAYSNGTVTVTIQQQMTAVAGKVRCKVKVTSGDKVVESALIIMVVDAAAVPDGSDMSKSDINDAIASATQKIVDQVKDSIPSDYSQLSADVSSLKQDFDNTVGVVGTFSKVVEDVTSGTTFYIKSKLDLNDITCHIIKDTIVSGKNVAINVRYSDNTSTVYPFVDGTTISKPGKTITSIKVYVDANYMPRPYSIAGYLTSSDLSGFLVKDAKNIKALEEKTQTLQTEVGFAEKISGTALAGQETTIVFLKNLFKSTVSVFVLKNTIEEGKDWAVYIKYSDDSKKYYPLQKDYFYVKSIGNYDLFQYKIDNLEIVDFRIYVAKNYTSKDATLSVIIGCGSAFQSVVNSYLVEPLVDEKISTKHIDEIISKYRYIIFGFANKDMQLCISGSNDACKNIETVILNIYKPSTGRGTLRDPSYMYYKGYWYFVYTTIDWASGNADIGFCRTKDMIHFSELPHLSCNNEEYPNIPRVYAPAFCILDNHIYIVSQGLGSGGTYISSAGTYDETNFTKCYVTMIHEYNPQEHTLTYIGKINGFSDIDTHIYKQGDYYYAAVKNFKLYKASSLLGEYTLTWNGTEKLDDGSEVYREGAFMIRLPDGKWRFFAQKPSTAYDYCDSLKESLDGGFGEIQTCNIDSAASQHFTIRDMLDTDYNVIS